MFSLHKDGLLDNVSQNNNVSETQWEHIIQSTPFAVTTNVALKSDGTVILGDVSTGEWAEKWLLDVPSWRNIVMLSADFNCDAAGTASALAGVDSQGNVFWCSSYYSYQVSFADYTDAFKDIKTLDIDVRTASSMINAVALRNDGKMASYINGKVSVEDAKNIVDVKVYQDTSQAFALLLLPPKARL